MLKKLKRILIVVASVLLLVSMTASATSVSACFQKEKKIKTCVSWDVSYPKCETKCGLLNSLFSLLHGRHYTKENIKITFYFSDGSEKSVWGLEGLLSCKIEGMDFNFYYNLFRQLNPGKKCNLTSFIEYLRSFWLVPFSTNWNYIDVPEDKWYYDAVMFVTYFRFMEGTSYTTFAPEEPLTRGMFVTTLYRFVTKDYSLCENKTPFADVESYKWYTSAMNWAYENKIVDGISSSNFEPDAYITREAACKIICDFLTYVGHPITGTDCDFADKDLVSPWAKSYVDACYSNNIVLGKNNNLFDPQGIMTRAEAASVIMNFCINIFGHPTIGH